MGKDPLTRKLAVILHADVVGSTSLVQKNETLAHERIQAGFGRLSEAIHSYGGLTREIRGDALVAEFDRASDAVSAALAFQADYTYLISRLKDDLRPTIRIGIAMGEVVIADDTVTGSGVVLAQRVEQLADPGGLCITEALHETLPKRLPFDLENLGAKDLKGFDDPVQVYRVELKEGQSVPASEQFNQSETSAKKPKFAITAVVLVFVFIVGVYFWFEAKEPKVEPATLERLAYPLPDKPSIAVLPFTNLSNETEQEAFVEGLTEDLITDLSKISGLFVVSRNSVWKYKGVTVEIHKVAEELGVHYVMEGSVRRIDNDVRINAQLIDALSGGHKWAERYDGSLNDVFAMQDDITASIVDELEIVLVGDEQAKLARTRTSNPDAYDAFVQGWVRYQRHAVKDFDSAIDYFEEAIQLDPGYSKAHAALAAIYWDAWDNNWAEKLEIPAPIIMKNAKEHVQQAMKQPDTLAYWVASNILIAEGDYEAAVKRAEQIIELDSNNAAGYAILAKALTLSGKTDEGAVLIEKAVRLDPYSSPLHVAAQKGDVEAARRLVADGVNVDAKDYYGKTPLHVTAETGHEKIAALLIEAGADIEVATPMSGRGFRDFGSTPLILATVWGHTRVAELLINSGADVNARTPDAWGQWTALHYAARDGREGIAELLLSGGADVNSKSGRRLRTPLFEAIRGEHESIVKLLISKNANVNPKDTFGGTPLHLATISGNYDTVSLLLANGADVNAKVVRGNSPGETPLHATAHNGSAQITELLLAHGAEVDATDHNGYTPLRRAVDEGQLAMAKLLIEKDADIATRDKYGITPLHVVAQTDRIAIAEFLIAKGADINAKDNNSSLTPLDYAQDGDEKMIEVLQHHGGKCTSC